MFEELIEAGRKRLPTTWEELRFVIMVTVPPWIFYMWWFHGRRLLRDWKYERKLRKYRAEKARSGDAPVPEDEPYQWQPEQDYDIAKVGGDADQSGPVMRKVIRKRKRD
ncbi:MAG: hypothetical protein AAF890_08680 [Pseudomonadota bacterium]